MKKYEDYLRLLADNNQPKGRSCWRVAEWLCSHEGNFRSILEIGRHKGHSLGLFKYLWPNSKIVSIDIEEHKEVFGILDLFDAHNSVDLINGNISSLSTDEIFDFVLIDGDHYYHSAKKDWEGIQKNISKGSIVLFDDLDHPCGCGKAFREIEHSYTTETINDVGGLVYI
jgi:predicted O-methyltransferase YrrM